MVYQNLTGYFAILGASAVMLLISIVAISRRERSWINWYTLPAAGTMATIYLLPAVFLWNFGTEASYYAFFFCYATYGLISLATAAGYLFMPAIRFRRSSDTSAIASELQLLPWLLLIGAFLLYLPVLLQFRQYLFQPREIYSHTRTGFGLEFFGSTLLSNLAFISYLFKRRRSVLGGSVLVLSCAVLVYLHGSKGQLIVLAFIALLYFVYARGIKITLKAAAMLMLPATFFVATLFLAFGSSSDSVSLAVQMASYSDYTRNAFKVIDDPRSPPFLGQLEFEDEFYSRIPRALMPTKPKNFGSYRLALQYYPGWFYSDTGSPAFGIGEQYADFRAFSILILMFGGMLNGWFARSAVAALQRRPSVGRFVIVLFFAGAAILPLGIGYLLPESLVLGAALDFVASRHRWPLSGIEMHSPGLAR